MTRIISFAVLIAFIILVGLLFYNVMIGFFVPVFIAAVLVVVFNPLHRWVLDRVGGRNQIASAITTFLILLIVLLPISLTLFAASVQGLRLVSQINASSIGIGLKKARQSFGLEIPNESLLRDTQQAIDTVVYSVEASHAIEPSAELSLQVQQARGLLEKLQVASQQQWGDQLDADFERLLADMDALRRTPKPQEEGTSEDDLELSLQQSTVAVAKGFSDLKTRMLGGTYTAFLKEIANPTSKQIQTSIRETVSYLQPKLVSATGATGSYLARSIFGGIIMLIATFFFFCDGPQMVESMMKLSPLDDRYEKELLEEFDRISRAVVLATIFSALAQGITASLGYFAAGWVSPALFDSLPLLFLLTAFFALIPFVGPAVVWVPVCCYLTFFEDRPIAALLLALWGVLVVGTIDNVVKAVVLHGQSQLHPLLALLSVLGGVQSLGPVGIVIGPMVVAMLQTLLSILQRELAHLEQMRLKSSAATDDASHASQAILATGGSGTVATESDAASPASDRATASTDATVVSEKKA